MRRWLVLIPVLMLVACGGVPDEASELVLASRGQAAVGAPAGSIPPGLPARLSVGLFEDTGQTWMKQSGVPWDVRYRYFTKGWVNNWGWGARDGSWGLEYFRECDAQRTVPAVAYYQMNEEPGGGEGQFLAKAQNATTMRGYFSDFKLLMQRAKDFGKPVLLLLEADGYAFLQQQSGGNPNAYAAVAATGLPELAGLPDTVAGWGMAFLQLKKAVGASNALLGIHVSGWASGVDLFHFNVTDDLSPHVDRVYDFLAPLGLAANQTGLTYDVLVGDPLDRDADYYRLVRGENRWWDASDAASIRSRSFNRYAEWMRLWNLRAQKRWVLWQIPVGNSNHLNVCNNGGSRQGYKDNRTEYFFGASGGPHREKFATSGAIALLFGQGEGCQASYQNDLFTDGQPYLRTRAGAFLKAGGLALPAGPGGGGGTPAPDAGTPGRTPDAGSPATVSLASTARVSPTPVAPGGTATVTAELTNTGAALSGLTVDVELFDAGGNRVGQHVVTGQALASGQKASFTYAWPVPASAAGTYTVRLGVFGANWTPLHHWNDSAATFTVQATATGDTAAYGFETGTDGWTAGGGILTGVSSSSTRAYAGTRSLAIQVSATANGQQSVSVASPPVPAGATVSFRVWVPSGSTLTALQPFVQEGASTSWRWTGTWNPASRLRTNAWNTLTVTVPSNASVPLQRLGVEVLTGGAWTGTLFLDSVSWGGAVPGTGGGTSPADAGTPTPTPDAGTPTTSTGCIRLMPLGDSITLGVNGGYRNRLYESLVAQGCSVDFVGSQSDPYTRVADKQHEGHSGFTIGNVAAQVDGWLSSHTPDQLVLMIGTNDVAWWSAKSGAELGAEHAALLDRILARRPNAWVIVASIPPLTSQRIEPNNVDRAQLARDLNATIRRNVESRQAQGKRVRFADVHAALTTADLYDGVHPTEAAHAKVAQVIGTALQGAVSCTGAAATCR